MDVGEAIGFPTIDEKWVTKVIVGGVLSIIPIVNFVSSGFAIKTMKTAIEGSPKLPEWENWGDLFVRGLVAAIIAFIYLIPAIIVALALGGPALFSPTTLMQGGGFFAALSAIAAGGIVAIAIGFILPMAIAMYVASDSMGAAFRIGEVFARIKSVLSDYVVGYIVIVILAIVLGLVSSAIPVVGGLISAFASFYVALVAAYIFGTLYAQSSA